MEEVATYLPAYEVRNLNQNLVWLNLEPVHSSTQHRETDLRKTSLGVLAQDKENTGRKKEKGSIPVPSSASS